ncbi:MAG TPA: Spo0B domain-containing protein, partial [Candidatus Limivivens intestinipullorum]|nr:Spo0B domain-containing protein [Candidatus Limivivens intestinipullorum]
MKFLKKRTDRRIAACRQELMETHYREVETMYRQMRGWRHDYRNHIQTLKAYAAAGDLAAVRDYLDKLDADLKRIDPVLKTGNP